MSYYCTVIYKKSNINMMSFKIKDILILFFLSGLFRSLHVIRKYNKYISHYYIKIYLS